MSGNGLFSKKHKFAPSCDVPTQLFSTVITTFPTTNTIANVYSAIEQFDEI